MRSPEQPSASKCAAPTRGAPVMPAQGKVLAIPLLYGAGGTPLAAGSAEQRGGDLEHRQGSSAAPSSCCRTSERGSGVFMFSSLSFFFLAGDVALKFAAGNGGWGACSIKCGAAVGALLSCSSPHRTQTQLPYLPRFALGCPIASPAPCHRFGLPQSKAKPLREASVRCTNPIPIPRPSWGCL